MEMRHAKGRERALLVKVSTPFLSTTMNTKLPSTQPDIRLFGELNQSMLSEFFRQQDEAPSDKPLVLELSTSGGDADIGRRMAQEIRQWRDQGADLYFYGKSFVYSAGISVMGAFDRDRRFLSSDCELLIHERKLKKDLPLDGALKACITQVKNILAELESGQRLERDGFEELVKGASLSLSDLQNKVCERDWYLCASEAEKLGLIAGIVH